MFRTVVERARATFQRRMVVTDDAELAYSWARELRTGVQLGWKKLDIPQQHISIAESDKMLGKTYPNLIFDMRGSFTANDLGKAIPTVAGGGVIILITPPFERWVNATLSYHEKLAIPPYSIEDCRHLFIPRLIRKFYEHEGIWIYRGGKWEKESIEEEIEVGERKKPKIPRNTFIPLEIYRIARTQDQVNVLRAIEELNGILVLTADRGRGKSAVIGLAVAGLRGALNRKFEVAITAPSREQAGVIFDFIEIGLKKLGIPFSYKNENMLLGKKIKVVYEEPQKVLGRKADLLVVDEAAGLPLPLLKKLAQKTPVIFSTTVHGYEGSGRTFSIRFMGYLKELGYVHYHMEEPIRYAAGDPIEKWLFDTLLLDAEPESVERLKGLSARVVPPRELFSNERLLRSFFGLLVIAHYKNTPNDLMTLADAPHHLPLAVFSDGRIVGAVQFAYEGGLSESQARELYEDPKPEGNLIPDIFCKHYAMLEFARYRGARIVRIVTHPSFWGRGIGSFALKELEREGVAWVGASFGASPRLVSFWIKNGFKPVNISPFRNPVSGEYSLVVVKPLTQELKDMVEKAHAEFAKRFLEALSDVYWDMEIGVAREILKSFRFKEEVKLSELERIRAEHFIAGRHVYEVDVDVITKLVKWYFLTGRDFLSEPEERVLIAKVLQRNTWKVASERTGVREIYETIREAIEKIVEREKNYNLPGG